MAPNKQRFCPHCEENVSIRTYQRHFDLYFNKEEDEWCQKESSDKDNCLVQTDSWPDMFERILMAMDEPDGHASADKNVNSEAYRQTGWTQCKN